MTSTTRKRIGAGSLVIGAALMSVGVFSPPAQADTGPEPFEGNESCLDRGYTNEFKIDNINDLPAEGDYTPDTPNTVEVGTIPAGFTITLDNVEVVDGFAEFDWAASADSGPFPIDAVLVKASNGANEYTYDAPGATSDTDLVSLKDSLSHLSFCWNDDGGTDGDDGNPTTTAGGDDNPTTTAGGVAPTTGSVAPQTEVKGVVVVPEQLPRTGSGDQSLFIIGMGFLTVGAIALVARRGLLIRS